MESTPALRNNWSYTSPEEAQRMAMESLNPVAAAVGNYAEDKYKAAAEARVAAAQARLQQLRMDAVAKNVSARDATMLEREATAAHSREQVALTQVKARSDATRAQGLNDQIKQVSTLGEKLGTPRPAWVGTGPDGTITDADRIKYINDFSAANEDRLRNPETGLIPTITKNYVATLMDQDKIQQDKLAYAAKNISSARSYLSAKLPPDTFIQQFSDNPKVMEAYTNAGGGAAGLQAAKLGAQYVNYLNNMALDPKIASEFAVANSRDPVAASLVKRENANTILMDSMLKDGKGENLSFAPEVIQGAKKMYAQTLADAAKAVATPPPTKDNPNPAPDPNHPAIQQVHNRILNTLDRVEDQQKRLGIPGVTPPATAAPITHGAGRNTSEQARMAVDQKSNLDDVNRMSQLLPPLRSGGTPADYIRTGGRMGTVNDRAGAYSEAMAIKQRLDANLMSGKLSPELYAKAGLNPQDILNPQKSMPASPPVDSVVQLNPIPVTNSPPVMPVSQPNFTGGTGTNQPPVMPLAQIDMSAFNPPPSQEQPDYARSQLSANPFAEYAE